MAAGISPLRNILMNPELCAALSYLATLQASWLDDVSKRNDFPMMWRPSIGLAILVHRFDQYAVAHGDRVFFPNHALTWLAIRDVPSGHELYRSGATMLDSAQATLAYGMPRLDFTGNPACTSNFRRLPDHSLLYAKRFGRDLRPDILDARYFAREWAVSNLISQGMTADARRAFLAGNGIFFSRRWPLHRLKTSGERAADWMPGAYLLFLRKDLPILKPWRDQKPGHSNSNLGHPIVQLDNLAPHVLIRASFGRSRPPVGPVGLWWDVTRCEDYLNFELESFIFPPLPVIRPDRVRLPLPGNVDLEASLPTAAAPEKQEIVCGPTLTGRFQAYGKVG